MAVPNSQADAHVLVVGGTRGIGREVVVSFAKSGYAVSIFGRHEPSEADRNIRQVRFWAVDVTNEDERDRALAEVVARARLRYLVFLQRLRGEGDRWRDELNISLDATMAMVERLADRFDPSADNSIVFVSSIADQFISTSQPAGYHVAKAGLVHLARYYAVALARKRIRVNSVSPCTVLKEENESFYANNSELHALFQRTVPLGRMGRARDIADAIGFLCSDKASFITGQNLVVDGGVSLQSQEALARQLTGI